MRLVADLDPFDKEVHSVLGQRELALGHPQAALVEFQVALALGPANPAEAHTNLGEALLAAGRRDEAKEQAFLALEQAPTFARAQNLLLAVTAKP